ncbi:Piso0_001780 [Millerozyma farinosa CBS 7064]|uniref:Piso0_001780 protein n=1 Tax=Pichia sorbitophila (strain ATCC MYA-4447 / BCRC 22081 / CBS 7064 / NBRC 10061 / NRRL Y-12695) TaxID=559304 RepID=G8YP28_PICSO|nr:Piso0_001780 [Millerozyma farinosa CBS 7064]
MSLYETEVYEDDILSLAQDPDLNREKSKTQQLIKVIRGFPPTVRRISKLCSLSFSVLQKLEELELNLKNWAFISLEINSANHFDAKNEIEIKEFNNVISVKVLNDCREYNSRLQRICLDIDYVTKGSRMLTPIEYISDSGTLLTSLLLRNIKLKEELADKLTIAYSKATLITIGTELEEMLLTEEDISTVSTYKGFVASLLKQLNAAIESEDHSSKYECLGVINDMEKMFQAFKLEKVRQEATDNVLIDKEYVDVHHDPDTYDSNGPNKHDNINNEYDNQDKYKHSEEENENETETEYGYNSDMATSYGSIYNPPLIHSITKSAATTPQNSMHLTKRRDSLSSYSGSAVLQKSTLSDELPYLMSAFDSARNFEEDITHYKEEDGRNGVKKLAQKKTFEAKPQHDISKKGEALESKQEKPYPSHRSKLPNTPLYSDSAIITPPAPNLTSQILNSQGLLSKLGIRPQVITTESLPKSVDLAPHTKYPLNVSNSSNRKSIEESKGGDNKKGLIPLTRNNLEAFNLSSFSIDTMADDNVE